MIRNITVLAIVLLAAPLLRGADLPEADVKLIEQAHKHYNAGEFDAALNILSAQRDKHPTHGEIRRLLGHTLYDLGQHALSRAELTQAIAHGRITADVVGRILQIDHAADRPIGHAVALLNLLSPDDRQNQMLLAESLVASGAPAEALRLYQQLIERDAANANLWLALGNLHMTSGKNKQAAAALETAYHLGDTTARLPQLIGDLWRQENQPAAALAWYDRAAAAHAKRDVAFDLRRAELALDAHDLPRANELLTPLTRAENLAIRGKAHLLLGKLAVARAEEQQAVEQWEKAIACGVDNRQLLAFAGTVRFNKKDYAKAADYLTRAAAAGEPSAELLRLLATSFIHTRQPEPAHAALQRYVERFGMDDTARHLTTMLLAN